MYSSDGIETVSGLRERNKRKRYDAILDAALVLLDDAPASQVTVDRVAGVAELAPATVYNLVGGRDEVLRAAAARIIEGIGEEIRARAAAGCPRTDPLWSSRLAIDLGSATLARRSGALRHLIAYLGSLGAAAPLLTGSDGTPLDAPDLHIATMRYAQRRGMIRRGLDPVVLGTLVANGCNGTLLRWSYGSVADAALAPMSHLAIVTVAASACTAPHRSGLEREMGALHRQVVATLQG